MFRHLSQKVLNVDGNHSTIDLVVPPKLDLPALRRAAEASFFSTPKTKEAVVAFCHGSVLEQVMRCTGRVIVDDARNAAY